MFTCRKIAFLSVAIVLVAGAQFASAELINTVENPSFEQPFIPPIQDMVSTPSGWLAYSPTGDGHPATINGSGDPSRMPNGAVAGNQAAWFDIDATYPYPTGDFTCALYQPGAITCQADMVYTVSLYNGFDAVKATEGAVHGGSVIELWAGDWSGVVASLTFPAGSAAPGEWVYGELSVSTAEHPELVAVGMNIRLGPMSVSGVESNNLWDNILVDESPVPEPSTLMLLATGILGLLACNRKK